jgi:hypothetical protein
LNLIILHNVSSYAPGPRSRASAQVQKPPAACKPLCRIMNLSTLPVVTTDHVL